MGQVSIHAYQWKPWEQEKHDPPVKSDRRGPYVMDGRQRLELSPLCWVEKTDDGHIHVHPQSWKGDDDVSR
jgi:hypothetical protein